MQESPSLNDNGDTILRGDRATPFKDGNALQVTPEQHAGITAFIRHLKPGIYVKCATCQKMKFETNISIINGTAYCGECSDG